MTEESALARMHVQMPDHFFLEHSDFIIKNNKDLINLETVSKEVVEKVKKYYIDQYETELV